MKANTGIMIEGYLVEVEVKKKEGVYFAQADSFFLVASTGDTLDECLQRLSAIFIRIRDVIFTKLMEEHGIEKAKL